MYLKYSAIASIDIHQPKLKVAVDCIQSLVEKNAQCYDVGACTPIQWFGVSKIVMCCADATLSHIAAMEKRGDH